MITLADLSEKLPDSEVPPLDRTTARPDTPQRQQWVEEGVAYLPAFIPDDVVDRYCEAWAQENDLATGRSRWTPTAYMDSPAVKELCLYEPLMVMLEHLLYDEMGLHLNLTNWRSTRRDWHQDDYLNPSYIKSSYAAVWFALDDIHPDAGPFQYVPGSHRWPVVRQDRILRALGEDGHDPDWPYRSEALLTPLYEKHFAENGVVPTTYVPKRGDVLIWHANLVHRGTVPNNPALERRACIAHYSGLANRRDMPQRSTYGTSSKSKFFVL